MSTYKRKRWGSKDRRIEAAVRLRAEGLSLREIAKRLKVSHDTVWRDLAKADEMSEKVVRNFPPGGRNLTPDLTSEPLSQVIMLAERRRA
jgi:transposase